LKSVEILRSSDKNKSAQFFETRCISGYEGHITIITITARICIAPPTALDGSSSQAERRKPCCRKEPRDAAAVVFGLKFADNFHYKFKSSQVSKARLQSYKHTGAKQNLTQNGNSKSRVLQSVERR